MKKEKKKLFNEIRRLKEFEEDIIEFVEIYYKGDKVNEDRERILRYYKKD